MRQKTDKAARCLYINFDDLYFSSHSLVSLAGEFYMKGGTHLFADDLHKYPGAGQELKMIYEELPGLKVIFTCISTLSIFEEKGEQDKIARLYHLPCMSFREFLEFRYQFQFPVIQFDDLLELNRMPGSDILNRIRPLQYFEEYLREGAYPLISDPGIRMRLGGIISKVLESDLGPVHNIDHHSLYKIRRLIYYLAVSGPIRPNIEKLAVECGTTRDSLLKFLSYLHQGGLISWLTRAGEKINYMNKPGRLLLNNSNLLDAVMPGISLPEDFYETFLVNQLHYDHSIEIKKPGKFLIDGEYTFELQWQGNALPGDGYTICEGLEYQAGTRIPLWMFGFLY